MIPAPRDHRWAGSGARPWPHRPAASAPRPERREPPDHRAAPEVPSVGLAPPGGGLGWSRRARGPAQGHAPGDLADVRPGDEGTVLRLLRLLGLLAPAALAARVFVLPTQADVLGPTATLYTGQALDGLVGAGVACLFAALLLGPWMDRVAQAVARLADGDYSYRLGRRRLDVGLPGKVTAGIDRS